MNVMIRDWYNPHHKPHPDAAEHQVENPTPQQCPVYFTLEIPDLEAFCRDHGPVIVSPPGKRPYTDGWFIWTSTLGDFKQR
jgi:hypothetical protein